MLIAQSNFLEQEIPIYHPATSLYLEYWREQKRRCIEGYWQSGYWMPPRLYFYANFATIKKKRNDNDKAQVFDKPLLRDIEWIVFRDVTVARGFSGFELDEQYSCYHGLVQDVPDEELPESCFKPDGTRKEYQDPREYIERQHPQNIGLALYENEAENYILMGARGFGKDLESSTLVHLKDKSIPISDIQIGDEIYGADGKLTKILSKQEFNNLEQFEVTFADGRKITCGDGHLWGVFNNDGQYKVLELSQIRKSYLRLPRKNGKQDSKYFVPYSKPIEYPKVDLSIDPYLLGFMVGDGGLTQSRLTFTTADTEVLDYLRQGMPNDTIINKIKSSKYAYSIVGIKPGINSLLNKFRDLGLMKHTRDKSIPDIYLKASVEQRLELLRGLMDTDGYIGIKGNSEFTTISEQLSKDVSKLLHSLGIRHTVKVKQSTYKKNGENVKCSKTYRFNIITSLPIFKLKRKLERLNTDLKSYPKANREKIAIIDIKSVGVKPSVCIGVDNSDKLFVAGENYVVTHNSYMVASLVAHEFLFDGLTVYNPTISPSAVDVVVGAGHTNFSADLLAKVKIMLDKLPGEQEILGSVYPSPFSKKTIGSLAPSSVYQAKYKKRVGNKWKEAGSFSTIKHVSYADNPFAAQGGRNTIMVYEEVGMHANILECYDASVENMRLNGRKFGTAIFLGTGGDMEGGSTLGAKEIFYNPGKYDAIRLQDTYEMKGLIGRFIPATYNLGDKYRTDGWTDLDKAKQELLRRRKLKEDKRGSEAALTKEIVNNPIFPSEMFLAENSAILPAGEAARRLVELESSNVFQLIEKVVELYFDPEATQTNGVNYKIDSKGKLKPITKFPHKDADREGAIIIYEFPATIDGKIPQGAYVIGHDPYRDDNERGESLASIYVVKTAQHFNDIGHDEIVAEYVGRPYEGMNKVNDTLLKLSLFYGEAKIYFENAVGNTKDYFEKVKRLDLLATKPTALFTTTASYARMPTIEYGYPMSNQFIKKKGISYLRDWLLQPRADNKRNIDLISSRALLQEIVFFSYEGNFDRVMGLMGAIFGLAQMSRELEDSLKVPQKMGSKNFDFIINNKNLFRNVATNALSDSETPAVEKASRWFAVG